MSQVIQMRRTDTAGKVPTVDQLEFGEFAVNITDGKLYMKFDHGSGPVIEEVGVASLAALVNTLQINHNQLRKDFDDYVAAHP